ncbi:MAG: hypothetical protein ACXAC8_04735 [Candidatus Hodarchaeales archaeon]
MSDNNGLVKEDTSDSLLTVENTFTDLYSIGIQLFLLFISIILVGSIIDFFLIYSKKKTIYRQGDFDLPTQIEFLKAIYHKLIIGLENIKRSIIAGTTDVKLLKAAETEEPIIQVEDATLDSYFSSHIRETLTSEMKGRTVITLIEIAYQFPDETHPARIAKILNIPPSTLSKEIQKLVDLEYIEPYASPQVLRDGRYRSYTVTPKGLAFLDTLKEALAISIDRLRERDQGIVV